MSTSSLPTAKGPIQLHYAGGQVVVTPEDQDRFVLASQQAVSACRNVLAVDRFLSQFQQQLLGPLHDWCGEHQEAVRGCYVPFPTTGICVKVFIVSRSEKFDLSLSDAIADLEVKLQDAGWRCDILQIASAVPDELRAFFDPEQSIQVFAEGNAHTAPREG